MPLPIQSVVADLKVALDARRPFLLAMREDEIERQPKVDASLAAEIVIGSAPLITPLRGSLIAELGERAAPLVDDLLVVARAAKQADVECDAALAANDLGPLEAEVRAEHTLLHTDAQSLANRKLLDPQRIETARSTLGYRTIIHNTLILVSLFRENWAAIAGMTPITENDLSRAEAKASYMLAVVGAREQGATRVPAVELRLRALSALVRHYDEVRRYVSFLRWHERDADQIAPSLYARRPGRRTPDEETTDPVETPVTPPVVAPLAAPSPAVSPTGVPLNPFAT